MNVWLYSSKIFSGKQVKDLDSVVDLFSGSARPKTNSYIWGTSTLWVIVHQTDDYLVYMGHQSPERKNVNILATRILIDTNQFSSAATLVGGSSDNPLHYCVRGCVAFYRISTGSSTLLAYPWELFCEHWPKFFRNGKPPYITLEENKIPLLQSWIDVNRGDKRTIKRLADLLGITSTLSSTKDLLEGNILVVMLRRLEPDEWAILTL